MCEGIVEATLRRAAGRRVAAITVRVGGHPVDPEVVAQGVALAAQGTEAEGARLELIMDPMLVRCHGCHRDSPVTDHLAMVACPRCGGVDIEVVGDDAVMLESLTLAAPTPAASAPDQQEVGACTP